MTSRLLSRQLLLNGHRLFQHKKVVQNVQPKRNHWIDDPPKQMIYRELGAKQDPWDWYGSVALMAFAVACTLINTYMYWDEIKLVDPPGVYTDLSVHKNKDLGVPPDDEFGYAPYRQDVLERGKVIDLGNTLRNERRCVYHVHMVRNGLQSPYDV